MVDINYLLKKEYNLIVSKDYKVDGGWSANAYIIETQGGKYFLKQYDNKRHSTATLTENLVSIYEYLDTLSIASLILPIKTVSRQLVVEEETYVYILFEYLEHNECSFSEIMEELVDILVSLHETNKPNIAIPVDTLGSIHRSHQIDQNGLYYQSIINDHDSIALAESLLNKLSSELHYEAKTLTHGDIHFGNIMVDETVSLIDFENVSLSLPELDFIFLYDEPLFDEFIELYSKRRPNYQFNKEALKYFRLRRQLTDIYEVLDDNDLEPASINQNKEYLADNIRVIKAILREEGLMMAKKLSQSVTDFWFSEGFKPCDSMWVITESALGRVMKLSSQFGDFLFLPEHIRKTDMIQRGTCITESEVDEIVTNSDVELNTPDCVFYFDLESQDRILEFADSNTRILTLDDQEAFNDFNQRTPSQDLEDAYVELDHWLVAGYFEDNKLMAIASMYPWFEGSLLCDTGIVSSPEARGKGYGKKLVQFISKEALKRGYEPQYRCQFDNHDSKRLAESIGMTLIGMVEIG